MKPKTFYFFMLLLIIFLSQGNAKPKIESNDLTILILPLGEISNFDVDKIQDSIQHFCSCEVRVLDRINDPQQILNHENKINPFDKSVFEFLNKYVSKNQEKIIGITDIPFWLDGSDESMIRGFSKINGNSTIISNAQIIRDAEKSGIEYDYLLVKVVKHELGHLFGMGHCPDTVCIMTSSFPSPHHFLNSQNFCDSCSIILQKNKIN